MPNLETVTIGGERYSIRHVGLPSVLWPGTSVPIPPEFQVLSQTLVARPLPMSAGISSPDFVSGSWTGRLDDAGECALLFPNREASDGPPWRRRFDPAGHLQFVEIYRNSELESVCVIDTVTVDQQQVNVHGQDGWFLLKKAYERDWVVVQAPRDVIERATQVWVPTTTDNFPAGALSAQWAVAVLLGAATESIGASGGLKLTVGTGATDAVLIKQATAQTTASTTWRAQLNVQALSLTPQGQLVLNVYESGASAFTYQVNVFGTTAMFSAGAGGSTSAIVPSAASYSLMLESDGEWVWAFVNGQLVGCLRRSTPTSTDLRIGFALSNQAPAASGSTALVTGILTEALQPFLQRGSDKGDYVLPGSASTYPSGGLHARYYNDTDLQGDANRLVKILAPSRSQAYAGSGTSEYANQQDATIAQQSNPTPGAAGVNWSAKWFGAIYLKLSQGDYGLQMETPTGAAFSTAVRVWVGKTKWGEQLVDQWAWQNANANYPFTVSASALAGTLAYGGGTVARDGWYPIVVEYAVDSGAGGHAPQLIFTSSPAAYTDPGGTAIASGAQATIVPATSLSPLGCVDQRYQGVSHFDLAQQTVTGFGYQASVEPKQLESGLFPGVLAPRIREGHDTDIILKPDLSLREDGEGLLNYSSTLDATDFASSLQGNGAGFQNGTTGQLQSDVYDPVTLGASLFDAQGWQDFSDASFASLLQALLNSALGLRLAPWQLLSADPTGSNRLAYTWPLPGALKAMRWRPGDGARVQARDINVWDTAPRQLLVITRQITPNGKTGASASWANRPRNPARALKQMLYAATRLQRNYQRQLVTLTGGLVNQAIGAGATGALSIVQTAAADTIVRAYFRISTATVAVPLNVVVNATDQTGVLNGPWTTLPVNLDVSAVATPDGNGNINVAVKIPGGAGSTVQYQLLVDVLR